MSKRYEKHYNMIRTATKTDFDYLYSIYMHPEINPWLLYEMMPPDSFRPIMDELLQKKALYIYEQEGKAVGMFKLVPMKFRNSHIMYLGGVAIHPDHAGKGYAKEMILDAVDLIKSLAFTRIELTVATGNLKAISLYEKCGFKTEGILKNYTFLKTENRYIDEQVMALLFHDS
jgi:L-phenylalanine/L-methionine N-acetyltransferase